MAAKLSGIARPPGDLERSLLEQFLLLEVECLGFDRGLEISALQISARLRLLLHESRTSKALLGQLGLRDLPFPDTSEPPPPRGFGPNLLPSFPGGFSMTAQGSSYVSATEFERVGIQLATAPLKSFAGWWEGDPFITLPNGARFARRALVAHVADKDGGAHVDPDLDPDYLSLSRNNGLGWSYKGPDGVVRPLQRRPELAGLRQIAHEVLSAPHVVTWRATYSV